jgi:hypothetical protein
VGLMTNDSNELFYGEYFEWLRSQVHVPNSNRSKQYYLSVLRRLHNREFVWTVPNDDNRVEDGRALRAEWGGSDHPFHQGVSILEMFVALSRHLEFQAGGQACYWAWRFIENLGLHQFPDGVGDREERAQKIEDILDTFVWRQYKRDGTGGIFPLAWPEEDQTKVELWYQMHAYLQEMQEL